MTMTKTEAQPWLGLYTLMMPKFSAKYDFNDFNKAQILKVSFFKAINTVP